MVFLAGGVLRLAVRVFSRVLLHNERIISVQKRRESLEQGGQLLVLEQSRGDDELAGPVRNQGGIGLDQLFDFRVGGTALISSDCVSGVGRLSDHVLLIRKFRSHLRPPWFRCPTRLSSVRRLFDETLP